MDSGSSPWPLVLYGLFLGWSIAWPPGPINAEIIRRGLARGFVPAFAVALGASTGDALWALSVVLGAGLLFAAAGLRLALEVLSTALLFLLAWIFLKGAWHGYRSRRRREAPSAPSRFDSSRAGYLLGLGMALTSPWNIAFWLAVIGRPETAQRGVAAAFVIALSVIGGTLSWCLLLCTLVVALRLRIETGLWELVAKGATGLLMLYFALRGISRLVAG
jgi:threonine/homoserine/homoserine lactone efflux protein